MATVIQNSLGAKIDLRNPRSEDIDIGDIAHSLSLVCRFGGHVKHFYSVAEHSILVANLLHEAGQPRAIVLAGLLHDAHEAYLGDVTTPVKSILREHGAYDELTRGFDQLVAEHAGLSYSHLHDPAVKAADEQALFIEAEYLMPAGLDHFHTPGVTVPSASDSRVVHYFAQRSYAPTPPRDGAQEFLTAWGQLNPDA